MTSSMSDEIVFLVFDAADKEIGYLTEWDDSPRYSKIYDFWMYASDLPADLLQSDGVYLSDVQAIFRVSPK